MQSKLLTAINQCIYCWNKENLTDEHVVPFGLGGNLILPKSSCLACNVITSGFELKVLRNQMQDVRAVAKLPTRRKAQRPKDIKTTYIQKDETKIFTTVPTDEAVSVLVMPIFTLPAKLYGTQETEGAKVAGIEYLSLGQNLVPHLISRNAVGITGKAQLQIHAFCRMLAKIAYSYYVGMRGLFPREESPALDILLGKNSNPSEWIGSSFLPISQQAPEGLHRLAIGTTAMPSGSKVDVVRLQLFAQSAPCTYEVVVRVF